MEAFIAPANSGKDKLLESLDQASQSILISMYSMSDYNVREKLVEKAEAGVKVYIVYNKGQCDGYKEKFCNDIEALGGNIRRFSKTNHQKFTVIDHELWSKKILKLSPWRFLEVATGLHR